MSLLTDVNARITQAMKAHDTLVLSTFRMLKSALTNKEIEKGRALEDAEALQVVATLVKQRRESIDQFQKGGRPELAAKETEELHLLETLLPAPATTADIEQAIEAAVKETGAAGMKDVGKVMKAVMAALTGKPADGKTVSELVRKRLS